MDGYPATISSNYRKAATFPSEGYARFGANSGPASQRRPTAIRGRFRAAQWSPATSSNIPSITHMEVHMAVQAGGEAVDEGDCGIVQVAVFPTRRTVAVSLQPLRDAPQ